MRLFLPSKDADDAKSDTRVHKGRDREIPSPKVLTDRLCIWETGKLPPRTKKEKKKISSLGMGL